MAYRWFCRFVAIRILDHHHGLPERVLINSRHGFCPRLAPSMYPREPREHRFQRHLVLTCLNLQKRFPELFTLTQDDLDYFPQDLLAPQSILQKLICDIPASYFEHVELLGWMHQFYISPKRENVIDPLHGKAIQTQDIPDATQLFTPDWIVKFLIDNTLGRYWTEHFSHSRLIRHLDFYIKSTSKKKKTSLTSIDPRTVTVFDPCVGAGHFLTYAFDVLIRIYAESGYSPKEAASLIIQHNLFGLDIDPRMIALSRFALILKAYRYDNTFLQNDIQPQVYDIDTLDDAPIPPGFDTLADALRDAKVFGSLIHISQNILNNIQNTDSLTSKQKNALHIAKLLCQKYTCVVTNPPYLNKYHETLKSFLLKKYKSYAGDLFSVFIHRNIDFCLPNGYLGYMTPNVWMFLKSYEALRRHILTRTSIISLVQLAKGAYFKEATVDICAFILQNSTAPHPGTYIRLNAFKGSMDLQCQKTRQAVRDIHCPYRFTVFPESFLSLPGAPIAYWIDNNIQNAFLHAPPLRDIATPCQGMATTDNKRFLRLWHEIDFTHIGFDKTRREALDSNCTWFPYNKGGSFRKWYGNHDYVVNYQHDGKEIKAAVMKKYPYLRNPDFVVKNAKFYFQPAISWSKISSGTVAFRFYPQGFLFDVSGCCLFGDDPIRMDALFGFVNSMAANILLSMISPTLNYETGHIASLPIVDASEHLEEIHTLVHENIELSRQDWDASETSWNFARHPLVRPVARLQTAFELWQIECRDRFEHLRQNEERLNEIFLGLYHLDASPHPDDKSITIRLADRTRDIKSLISYAIGVWFGRYSLDVPGIAFAGGIWDPDRYTSIRPVHDNILPVSTLTAHWIEFLRVAFGPENLDENIAYSASSIRKYGTPIDILQKYFKDGFYADHIQRTQKRPFYWMIVSRPSRAFQCLIYIHRGITQTLRTLIDTYIPKQIDAAQNDEEHQELDALKHTIERLLTPPPTDLDKLDEGVLPHYARLSDILVPIIPPSAS